MTSAGAGLPSFGSEGLVCVAQIGAPHGVRGEVRLKSFTAEPEAVARYSPLVSEEGRLFEVVSLRRGKDMLIVRLKGVDDRSAAETLTNLRLYAAREKFSVAEEDEFYHADLIGLTAVGSDGRNLGTVVAVPNFGAGDLIEIASESGGPTVLLPFTKAVVPEVDIVGRRLVIDPPDGAFDVADTISAHSRESGSPELGPRVRGDERKSR